MAANNAATTTSKPRDFFVMWKFNFENNFFPFFDNHRFKFVHKSEWFRLGKHTVDHMVFGLNFGFNTYAVA